jgi:hypothetical protein
VSSADRLTSGRSSSRIDCLLCDQLVACSAQLGRASRVTGGHRRAESEVVGAGIDRRGARSDRGGEHRLGGRDGAGRADSIDVETREIGFGSGQLDRRPQLRADARTGEIAMRGRTRHRRFGRGEHLFGAEHAVETLLDQQREVELRDRRDFVGGSRECVECVGLRFEAPEVVELLMKRDACDRRWLRSPARSRISGCTADARDVDDTERRVRCGRVVAGADQRFGRGRDAWRERRARDAGSGTRDRDAGAGGRDRRLVPSRVVERLPQRHRGRLGVEDFRSEDRHDERRPRSWLVHTRVTESIGRATPSPQFA